MIVSVTLNPSVDHALFLDELKLHDTNRVKRVEKDAGGKGVNLSRVAKEIGGGTLAIGFLGGGPGAYVRSVLDREGVSHEFVPVSGDTRVNFSVEDGSDQPPTTFNEKGPVISESELTEFLELADRTLERAKWLCIGGSLPQNVPTGVYAQLTKLGRSKGVKVVLDADGEALKLGLLEGPDLIKPNAQEAERFLGYAVDRSNANQAATELRNLLKEHGNEHSHVLISLGADGAVLSTPSGNWIADSPKVDVKSTIGSGDSMIAGYVQSLVSGKTCEESFAMGVACGAATASTDGSEIARLPVIQELLSRVIITEV